MEPLLFEPPEPPLFAAAPRNDGFDWSPAQTAAYDVAPKLLVMPKRGLRECIEGVDAIADTIEALDDEAMTEELRDELSAQLIEAIAGTRAKVDATASVLGMFESLEAASKRERERLEKREAYYARQTQRLSDYVLAVLEASKLDRIEGQTSSLARRKNPPKVVIDDESKLDRDFLRYPPVPAPVPDKSAIAAALKDQREVAGARLVQTVRLVRS